MGNKGAVKWHEMNSLGAGLQVWGCWFTWSWTFLLPEAPWRTELPGTGACLLSVETSHSRGSSHVSHRGGRSCWRHETEGAGQAELSRELDAVSRGPLKGGELQPASSPSGLCKPTDNSRGSSCVGCFLCWTRASHLPYKALDVSLCAVYRSSPTLVSQRAILGERLNFSHLKSFSR